ncbi:HlyD family type I secretion periplasmic adaptor subunit [soil metagenome]
MMDNTKGSSPAQSPRRLVSDSPRRDLILGGGAIAIFFGLFLGWAAFAPLDAGAFAHGQVAISGNRQTVQHREGGQVSALHVAEGDHVRRGAILIELATGELRASERGVAGQVLALEAQRARMIAERDGLVSIPTPAGYAGLAPEDVGLAQEAMRLQRLQFGARKTGRTTERGVLSQRIGQLDQQAEGFQRQIDSNLEQRRLIEEELDGIRTLAAKGFAPVNRVRALERNAAAIDGELGSLRAQIARTREAVGETHLEMLGVSTKMNEDVADQLRQVEVQLNELEPRWAELKNQIALAQVRAPTDGQVVGLTVFTIGGVIAPGQTLMDIVPDKASQLIVASVNPNDIDNLRVGLVTEVKFPGLRERSTPILHGTVTRLSADSFKDEASKQSFYRAEVVVPASELAKLGASASHIRLGMPVEVVVILKKRTALQYLVDPLIQSLWRSGSEQ